MQQYNPGKKQFNTEGFNEFKKSEKQFRHFTNRKVDDFDGLLRLDQMTSADLATHQITISHIEDIRAPNRPPLKCYNFAWP
jgi:hypothetical protein